MSQVTSLTFPLWSSVVPISRIKMLKVSLLVSFCFGEADKHGDFVMDSDSPNVSCLQIKNVKPPNLKVLPPRVQTVLGNTSQWSTPLHLPVLHLECRGSGKS